MKIATTLTCLGTSLIDLYFVYHNDISLSLTFLQDLLLKVNDLVSEQKKDVRFGTFSTVEVRVTVL